VALELLAALVAGLLAAVLAGLVAAGVLLEPPELQAASRTAAPTAAAVVPR
jgi:hypothetical protein